MKPSTIIFLSVLEVLGIALIIRLWMQKHRRKSLVARIMWSLVLLVPGFGLMIYALIHVNPDAHPDYMEEFGSDPPDDVGGSGGDGHGH